MPPPTPGAAKPYKKLKALFFDDLLLSLLCATAYVYYIKAWRQFAYVYCFCLAAASCL